MGNNLLGLLLRKNGRCSVLRMFSISLNLTNMAYGAVTCSREQMSTRILDWFMLSTTFNCVIHVTHAVFSFELASVWKLSLTKLDCFKRSDPGYGEKRCEHGKQRGGESEGTPIVLLTKAFSGIPDSMIDLFWQLLSTLAGWSLPWLEMWCNSDDIRGIANRTKPNKKSIQIQLVRLLFNWFGNWT